MSWLQAAIEMSKDFSTIPIAMLAWSLFFCFAWQYYFERNLGYSIQHTLVAWPLWVALTLIVAFLTGSKGALALRCVCSFVHGFLMSAALTALGMATFFVSFCWLRLIGLPSWMTSIISDCFVSIARFATSFGFGGMIISWIVAFIIFDRGRIGNRFRTSSLTVKACVVCAAMCLSGALYGVFH